MNAKRGRKPQCAHDQAAALPGAYYAVAAESLREITVRELTELAGISRGTFYFHYADIYALMDQLEAAQLARLNDLMDTLIPSISQEDAPPALVALFTYMTENPDLCQALYGKSWESEFTRTPKS